MVAIGLTLSLAGSGCGQASGTASPDPPAVEPPVAVGALTPAAARTVVSRLWAARETALSTLDASRLRPIESGAAQAADGAYIRGARCGCEPRKSGHPLLDAIPMIPHGSHGAFIAQVRTTNSKNEHPWYLIGITPDRGRWKIGLVTFGGYQATSPMHKLTSAVGYTPRVAQADTRRMAQLILAGIRRAGRHKKRTSQTDYGATLTVQDTLRKNDGVYGLRLASDKEFVCYTMHELDTYVVDSGGLLQNRDRTQWGALLAPGAYSAVQVDRAQSVCAVGRGVTRANAGTLWLDYDSQVVGTTGTPLSD